MTHAVGPAAQSCVSMYTERTWILILGGALRGATHASRAVNTPTTPPERAAAAGAPSAASGAQLIFSKPEASSARSTDRFDQRYGS